MKYVYVRREVRTDAPGVNFAVFTNEKDQAANKWLRKNFGQYLPGMGEKISKIWLREENEKVWTIETTDKMWRMPAHNRLQFLNILLSIVEGMEVAG